MNDESLESNLHTLVEMYLDEKLYMGARDYTLVKETGLAYIQDWNCEGVAMPDIETFRSRSQADIDQKRNGNIFMRAVRSSMLPVLTTQQRNRLPVVEMGMIILNRDEARVQCYVGSGWQNL